MQDRSSKASKGQLLQAMLGALSLWACAESVLVWNRLPRPHQAFPEAMQWQGQWLKRRPPSSAPKSLPERVLILGGADYHRPGSPKMALRWVGTASSGSGVFFPLQDLAPALLGRGATGVCRVYSDDGKVLLGEARTEEALEVLLRRNAPRGHDFVVWMLGIRPWSLNRCLYVAVAASSIDPPNKPIP